MEVVVSAKGHAIIADLLASSERRVAITFSEVSRLISSIIRISLTPSRNSNYRLLPRGHDIRERKRQLARASGDPSKSPVD